MVPKFRYSGSGNVGTTRPRSPLVDEIRALPTAPLLTLQGGREGPILQVHRCFCPLKLPYQLVAFGTGLHRVNLAADLICPL